MDFRRFLYWLPGREALNDDLLARLGLSNVLPAAATLSHRGCERGPDGGEGNVVGLPAPPGCSEAPFGYYPADQVWRRCGAWWLGMTKGAQPGPDDLARPQQLRGHVVKLAEGHAWHVPAAVRCDLQTGSRAVSLPQALDLDDDGKWFARPLPRFTFFSQQVELAWDFYAKRLADPNAEIDPDLWLSLAVEALALNYYVGKWELACLGALSTALVHQVIEAVLDVPTMIAAAEARKKAGGPLGSSPTACGGKGS
jgi:hypothetical protein